MYPPEFRLIPSAVLPVSLVHLRLRYVNYTTYLHLFLIFLNSLLSGFRQLIVHPMCRLFCSSRRAHLLTQLCITVTLYVKGFLTIFRVLGFSYHGTHGAHSNRASICADFPFQEFQAPKLRTPPRASQAFHGTSQCPVTF
ncbi:hypothetical protein R3P38DRAFT_3037500 [Favolaschia claudopus]|uniref:Uncharacterized protein n=1 Tax=Favolaschia claudopus TaxID=2862362 RepID=A0AAW0AAL3_9AGAR